jgi:hypothetical protein
MGMRLTRRHIIELGVEVLVALALVAAAIFYAEIGPFPWMPSVRWWMLATTTATLVWLAAKQYRAHRRRLSFWLTLAALVAIHVSVWSVMILRTESFGLLWFVVAAPVEGAVVVFTLEKAGFGSAAAQPAPAAAGQSGGGALGG